jgi:hypothetical protein
MKSLMKKIVVFLSVGLLVSPFVYGRASAAVPTDAPTSVTVSTKDGTGTATIKWTPLTVAGVNGYKVRARIGNVTVKTAVVTGGSSESYTFTGLEYKIPYTLGVKAGNSSGYAADYTEASSAVTLQAAPPSPPDKPLVAVTKDGEIDATWAPPSETGGSSIVSYSVQLWNKGEKFGDPKLPTTTATSFDTKGDTTSQFTVTVQAVNAAGLVSIASDSSESIVAKKTATAAPATPSGGNSGSGGSGGSGGNSGGGGSNSPTNSPQSSGGENNSATNTPVPSASKEDQLTRIVSPVYAAPAAFYSKTVTISAKTTTKTLLSLSRLSVPKGSTTSYVLSTSSRKYCSLKGTVVTAMKAGTCSITVTVKQKTGKKTSKVVKLVVKKRT